MQASLERHFIKSVPPQRDTLEGYSQMPKDEQDLPISYLPILQLILDQPGELDEDWHQGGHYELSTQHLL